MAMTAAQKQAFVNRMAKARGVTAGRQTTTALAIVPATSRSLGPPPRAPQKSLARRVASASVVAAVQEKELLATGVTAAAIGYVEGEGWLNDLPESDSLPIGKPGSLAIAAYVANRWFVRDPETKKILSGITNAGVAIASYNLGKGYSLKKQAEKALSPESGGADDLDDDGKHRAGI